MQRSEGRVDLGLGTVIGQEHGWQTRQLIGTQTRLLVDDMLLQGQKLVDDLGVDDGMLAQIEGLLHLPDEETGEDGENGDRHQQRSPNDAIEFMQSNGGVVHTLSPLLSRIRFTLRSNARAPSPLFATRVTMACTSSGSVKYAESNRIGIVGRISRSAVATAPPSIPGIAKSKTTASMDC